MVSWQHDPMPNKNKDWPSFVVIEKQQSPAPLQCTHNHVIFPCLQTMLLAYAHDVSAGMAYLHGRNIIHGDLKLEVSWAKPFTYLQFTFPGPCIRRVHGDRDLAKPHRAATRAMTSPQT